METTAWLIPLLTGIAGALIGTYGGSFFLNKMQEKKIKKVRRIAIKALKIFEEYAKSKKTYDKASEQFNINLKVAEKRAVLVALHKLGVPICVPSSETFNVINICFSERLVEKDEVEAMIQQLDRGYCDHLFFWDLESYFTYNFRINSIRNIGKKYAREVLSKSKYDNATDTVKPLDKWEDYFSHGEIKVVSVFIQQLLNSKYFDTDGKANVQKISDLIKEIDVGIWDNYLLWDSESYQNMIAQKALPDFLKQLTNQPIVNQNGRKVGKR